MKWKRKVLIVIFLVFICLEMRPFSIVYSSVFTTSEQTELHLYVQMNTLLGVNEDVMAEKIIEEHQRINQQEGKIVYTLHLYRTGVHYRWNREYNTIKCDENGAIICCRGNFRV